MSSTKKPSLTPEVMLSPPIDPFGEFKDQHQQEFEKNLYQRYPLMYRDMYGDMKHTCMAWGLDIGPGWYGIIERLSAAISKILQKMSSEEVQEFTVAQVKEKFGSLSFYIHGGNDSIYKLIRKAEQESAVTCEQCGQPAEIKSVHGWYSCLCDPCRSTQEKERQSRVTAVLEKEKTEPTG